MTPDEAQAKALREADDLIRDAARIWAEEDPRIMDYAIWRGLQHWLDKHGGGND